MTADEKARKLAVPTFRQIHDDFGGMISLGDIACIVGQRMHDMLMEMHEWTLSTEESNKG